MYTYYARATDATNLRSAVVSTTNRVGSVVVNRPPVADAGGPYTVSSGGSVVLDGSGSTDPDQSAGSLAYAWDLDGDGTFGETGAAAGNGIETGPAPTYLPKTVATDVTRTISLRVTDAAGLTDTDAATVNVRAAAIVVTADAGGPYSINEGASLSLNASASTAPAGATYSWDVDGDGTFGDATGASPTLTWTQLKALSNVNGLPVQGAAMEIKLYVVRSN